jgi:hypothetical protein
MVSCQFVNNDRHFLQLSASIVRIIQYFRLPGGPPANHPKVEAASTSETSINIYRVKGAISLSTWPSINAVMRISHIKLKLT